MSLPANIIFPSDPSEIENGVKRNLERYEQWYLELCDKQFASKEEFFEFFEQTESWDLEQECYDFMQYVHPDEAIRNASVESSKLISEFSNKWAMDTNIYRAISNFYYAFLETLVGEESLYLERTMRSYRHNGIHLDEPIRKQLESLNTQLSELSIQYSANLSEVKDCLYFSAEELVGVEGDFLDTLEKDASGKYKLTTQYDHINKIMPYCEVESTRKSLSQLFGMRGKEPFNNHELLQKALDLRKEKVALLGHSCYADYRLSHRRMAENSVQVREFLDSLVEKMRESSIQDVRQLASHFNKTEMESWNLSYYTHLYKKEALQLDQKEVQKYFPLEQLLPNLLGTFETIFQLRIAECALTERQSWHDSVKCFGVYNNVEGETDELIGHFYVDLYPREGKYGHAAAFTLKQAYMVNGVRSTPVSAMVCNFTRATKEKPSLLTFGEVETFFHELGHIFHQLLSKNRFSMFSGTAVEQDFVECPSQALENWCYESEFLTRISSHYVTGAVMPDSLMAKLKDNKQLFNGLHYIRQLQFALYDMELHASTGQIDVILAYNEIQAKMSPLIHCDGCMAANFGHLMGGYESGYYGYLWSEVYATEVFRLFKDSGNIFNREIGLHYRRCILEKGGTEDGFAMMKNLLGRMPNSDAFLQQFA
jgi:thimet oligopeptidase